MWWSDIVTLINQSYLETNPCQATSATCRCGNHPITPESEVCMTLSAQCFYEEMATQFLSLWSLLVFQVLLWVL